MPEADRYLGMAGPVLWWRGDSEVDLDVARFKEQVALEALLAAEAAGDPAGAAAEAPTAATTPARRRQGQPHRARRPPAFSLGA